MNSASIDKIAVIGYSAKFPGPSDLKEWWEAILNGDVLTTKLTKEQLKNFGVQPYLIDNPEYVPVRGFLSDADRFDHEAFRISPRDAEMMDPQFRMMLETTWNALEDAGYGMSEDLPVTGVFASSSGSGYARAILSQGPLEPDLLEQVIHGTEPDFIASLISYKLNLKGPSIGIQTACSSSLVGVHLACQSIMNGNCDQAIVVAAGVAFPQGGHLYIPGGINSETGVCSPFDEKANGVVEGSGVACVVLRRLSYLHSDSVQPHGVILGSAINNDGAEKAGYFAPSISGQISVIKNAVKNANIDAKSIGYLETHGTGTHIGDPIEWTSTSEAYRELGAEEGQIAIGALKANIGHLDAASGLASLIKSLQVIKEGKVPPIANFESLNPYLDANGSPLTIPNGKIHTWPENTPRRAAISAFGIGGTNAHIIIEEATQTSSSIHHPVSPQILQISAAQPETLDRHAQNLGMHLTSNQLNPADVFYTLSKRTPLTHRSIVCGETSQELAQKLSSLNYTYKAKAPINGPRPIIFLFSGQGNQQPGMGIPFASVLPDFQKHINKCLEHLDDNLRRNIENALFDASFLEEDFKQTRILQPALFTLEYAIGKSLITLGISPCAVLGHSLGEIVAGHFAGAYNLENAVRFVVSRGKAMQSCPEGLMLAVNLDEAELKKLILASGDRLSIAAINAPDSCVLAGTRDDIESFKNSLQGTIKTKILDTNRAFHSHLVEPSLSLIRSSSNQLTMLPLSLPLALNLDGSILDKQKQIPHEYFVNQARHPVLFSQALRSLALKIPDALFLEVGHGQTLSSLAAAHGFDSIHLTPQKSQDPITSLKCSLGVLWTHGFNIDFSFLNASQGKRLHLPTYPFKGRRWLAPEVIAGLKAAPEYFVKDIDTANSDKPLTVKETLKRIWSETLNYDSVEDDSNFYDLGGDSLSITNLIRKVNQAYNIKVPPRTMLSAQTFKDQLAVIRGASSPPDSLSVQITPSLLSFFYLL